MSANVLRIAIAVAVVVVLGGGYYVLSMSGTPTRAQANSDLQQTASSPQPDVQLSSIVVPTQSMPVISEAAASAAAAGIGDASPSCFEPMPGADPALAKSLKANSMLCATATHTGQPVPMTANDSGALSAGTGAPTAWMRTQ